MLKLVEPDKKYLDEYKEAYVLTLNKIKEGLVKKHDLTFSNPDEVDVIKKHKDSRDINKLPSYYVPSYNYFFVDDDKFIGEIHIRVRLTDNLLKYGGHIGYAINPKYWNQGYGTKLLELGLKKAKDLIEEDRVLITCDDDNIASYKVIEANGGVLENKVENTDCDETFLTRRYWINLNK